MNILDITIVASILLLIGIIDAHEPTLTPDGKRYMAMAQGLSLPRPFNLRPLLPWLLGDRLPHWQALTYTSLLATVPLLCVYLDQHRISAGNLWAALLVCGLAGVWRFPIRHPVLVDPFGIFCALGAAVLIGTDTTAGYIAAGVLVGVGTLACEKTFVFAALFAWSLVPLAIGLPIVALVYWRAKPGNDVLDERNAAILKHPWLASRVFHRDRWFDPLLMLAPWGAALAVLGTTGWSTQLWLTLAIAYSQLLVATDSVRLYQWAFPVVILGATPLLGEWLWLPILAVHLLNPWKGDGV